jgi:hypothetical protein
MAAMYGKTSRPLEPHIRITPALTLHGHLVVKPAMATTFPGTTDFEKGSSANVNVKGTETPLTNVASSGDGDVYEAERPSFMTRLGLTPDSFRRRTLSDKHNQLNKTLKSRHLSMIAIGGSIGAGLFVGSGNALSRGGPAGILIAFGQW